MSRAFPFPPPGYVRSWAHGQNLVGSTKLLRDIEVAKKVPRKEKKERERRKERTGKVEKSHKIVGGSTKKVDDKLGQYLQKQIEDETEQREKSGLTEEHEQPQNLCCLSDDIQSNNKRKRQDESPFIESQNQAKPLRIRFVLREPKESEAVPQKERLCSTSGAESRTLNNIKVASTQERYTRTRKIASTSTSESKNPRTDTESMYQALFEDRVSQELKFQPADVDDDEDWLFGSKHQEKSAVRRFKAEDVGKSSGGSSSWRRAQFLSDAGIYTLPYTIPV